MLQHLRRGARIGIVHPMAYPDSGTSEDAYLSTARAILTDIFFDAIEVTHPPTPDAAKALRAMAECAGVTIYYAAQAIVLGKKLTPTFEPIRKSMGYALKFAQRMDLKQCKPMATGYCLANPGKQYLAYQPAKGAPLKLKLEPGNYRLEWFDPGSGKTVAKGRIRAKKNETTFKNPVDAEAVLYVYSSRTR